MIRITNKISFEVILYCPVCKTVQKEISPLLNDHNEALTIMQKDRVMEQKYYCSHCDIELVYDIRTHIVLNPTFKSV
ncbi:hypothetical protein JCM14036_22290 [Desulfotomaculum defluvii]